MVALKADRCLLSLFFYCFETEREKRKGDVEEKRDRSSKVTKREKIKIRAVKNRSQRRDGGKEEDEEGGKQRDKTEEQRRDGGGAGGRRGKSEREGGRETTRGQRQKATVRRPRVRREEGDGTDSVAPKQDAAA